jgi:ParB/RepB/Spo0J family partition protein
MRYTILDGGRRWLAAQRAGMTHLDAIVLDRKPSATELHILQASIDAHRKNLTAMERSNLVHQIRTENNWSVTEAAVHLHWKQPTVTKLLSYQGGSPEVKAALQAGTLDMEKAYLICAEPDHDKQRELLKQAGNLSRDQFRQKVKSNGKAEVKAPAVKLPMPGQMTVSVAGPGLAMTTVIEVLQETVRQLKKAQGQGLDVSTAMRVFRDTAKAGK